MKHVIQKTDIIVFGFGSLTGKLITDLLNNNYKIICITSNLSAQKEKYNKHLNFLTYQNAIKNKISSNLSIFTWRQDPKIIENKDSFFEWLHSDFFTTERSFLLSSASVYKDSVISLTESQENLEPQVKLNAKYILEIMLTDLMKYRNFAHTNLRISNVYGPNLDYGFIGSLMKSIKSGIPIDLVKDQEVVRDYIYVADVSRAIQELIRIDTPKEILNISTGIGTSIGQILEIFSSKGFNFQKIQTMAITENFKQSSVLNCDELSRIIHWKPITVDDALGLMLKK